MSWVITPQEKTPVDPQFTSVALLLHAESLVDSSRHSRTITANGNAAVSTTQKKFGNSSFVFDGSGDWLSVAYGPDLDLTSGDFTVEAWIWRNVSSANQGICASRSGNTGFGFQIDGNKLVFVFLGSGVTASSSSDVPTETWTHVAFSRSENTYRSFVNGSQVATTTNSANNVPSSSFVVAARQTTGTDSFNGYIDDLRITKGVARYTANFTPPTAAFPDI